MKISFPKQEKAILKFWDKEGIFEKSLKKGKKAKNFVFYEGPPTANGKPGIHHVLSRVFKDIICRYKTMQGFRVERKAGWDTHGLPVELEIEKKLNLHSKKEIERYGIARFNKKCKQSVWEYEQEWEKFTKRIGFWLDLENSYITYTPQYIETVWWIIKQIHDSGLLYQGFKVVHYCPRCGTPLSSHEVAQGYKKIKEPAIYVKLKIKNPEFKNTCLLVWTTTPWTLPGNVAVAVNPNLTYIKVKEGQDYLIVAKKRMKDLGLSGEAAEEFQGKDLMGLIYEPLYPHSDEISRTAYRIIPGKFVSLEEGTGLVHIAPAFGEEDMDAVKSRNRKLKETGETEIPILITINEEGRFKFDVKKWAGMFFKEADPLIIENLEQRELLFKQEPYEHDYPFCWRCKTPLLYYVRNTWFIKMKKLQKEIIENNNKINWIPSYLKEGRFGEWLREIKDWALSRERYWGTPLPVWKCKSCNRTEVMGSREDFLKKEYSSNAYFFLRHGDTIRTAKGKEIIYSREEDASLGLTDQGKNRVKSLASRIKNYKIDVIISSDYFRARETAEITAQALGLKIKFDKKLRDVDLGEFRGKPKEELYRAFPDMRKRFYKKPRRGEDWLHCRKRMLKFIKETEKKYKSKNILVVSHGDPLWLLEGALKGRLQEELVEEKLKEKTIRPGELREVKFVPFPFNDKAELDFHRPYVDKIKFSCPQCQGEMEREPDVMDCWFDAGSMPFAQYHYPFENKNIIDTGKQFPADYICEAVDQTRGWFYNLLAVSTLLKKGAPFRNVVSLGHILDDKGEKMSKSRGNIVDPWYIMEKYGIDTVRWYFYTANQPGEPKLFSEKEVKERLKKFISTFWNCSYFFSTYAPQYLAVSSSLKIKSRNILDKWIVSKLNSLVLEVTGFLNAYDITSSARLIEDFVINDLSLWYVRRSRKRFQNPQTAAELKRAAKVLGCVLLNLSRLSAPFIPFLSEQIYQKINKKKKEAQVSVHLDKWPKASKKDMDSNLNERMAQVRQIVTGALAERAKAGIKVRQPLLSIQIKEKNLSQDKELLNLIKEEINVKNISFGDKMELDTKITEELAQEGMVREVVRNIQQMRKEAGFTPEDTILVYFESSPRLAAVLKENKKKIIRSIKAADLLEGKAKKTAKKDLVLGEEKLKISIKKVKNNHYVRSKQG